MKTRVAMFCAIAALLLPAVASAQEDCCFLRFNVCLLDSNDALSTCRNFGCEDQKEAVDRLCGRRPNLLCAAAQLALFRCRFRCQIQHVIDQRDCLIELGECLDENKCFNTPTATRTPTRTRTPDERGLEPANVPPTPTPPPPMG